MRRTLTAKTTLDTLRKDAKRWLNAFRAGDKAARRRLNVAWPKAPAEPSLRDVQHALALEYGQNSWIALKAALDDLALDRQTHLQRVEAVLRHAWDGDLSVARRIVDRYPEVRRHSLFTAAACGDLNEVRRHLAESPEGAQHIGGDLGWPALAYVTYGRLDPVNGVSTAALLLEAGADPNFRFDDGCGSPFKLLTGAIRLGERARPSHPQATELARLLIGAGADPYDPQSLYNVSIVGEDVVDPLYWYDLLWRQCEAKGRLQQWRTVAQGNLGFSFGMSTLDYLLGNAVGMNQHSRASWLLERGADPNTDHAYVKRPVHAVAQLSGFVEVAELLPRNGALPAELAGVEAFQAACLRQDEQFACKLLRDNPALVDDPAPLLKAAELGNAGVVGILLNLGADVQRVDEDGISPLHRAVQSNSIPALKSLLAAGADPDLRERKWRGTPISWALVLGRPRLVEHLLPVSRDVRALTSLCALDRLEQILKSERALANRRLKLDDAPTPLFCLPDDDPQALLAARLLLSYDADPRVRDARGQTPADAARARGLEEAAALLDEAARA